MQKEPHITASGSPAGGARARAESGPMLAVGARVDAALVDTRSARNFILGIK